MTDELLSSTTSASSGAISGTAADSVSLTRTGDVLRVSAARRPPNSWDAQLQFPATGGYKKGDTLLLTLQLRAVKAQPETGEGRTSAVVERGEEPWTKSLDQEIPVTREWVAWSLPFVAVEDVPPGKLNVNFRLGYGAQVLEFKSVALVNYGSEKKPADLPRTRFTYAGSEASAPWRREAARRIEKFRKGNLEVRVVERGSGKPVPDATVRATLKKHHFKFGSAVAADTLLASTRDGDRYRETILQNFNRVTIENNLKWPAWETWGKQDGLRALDWLRSKDIETRGHCLIWPSWRNTPEDLPKLDKAALRKRAEDHFAELVPIGRGKLVEWDVINETYDNHDITDILGRDSLIRWFQLARQYDSKARLYLNDYPSLDSAGSAHLDHFEDTLQFLQKGGAPIGGLGFQGHFGSSLVPPVRVLACLDRFAKRKLPIAITEFDINMTDEELQANYTRDFMTACFSHPAVDQIIMWGFWEANHWFPNAALWRKNWSLKPNGAAWLDLVQKQWKTDATGTSDRAGRFATRGFLGEYEVMVKLRGKTVTKTIVLDRAGARLTLEV
jgi:endo-1,4-beta-xylanase